MKSKLLALVLLAGSTAFGARIGFGFGVGVGLPYPGYYAPPPVVAPYAYAPYGVAPGVGYTWISPYYYPVGAGWGFRAGYWARPRMRVPVGSPRGIMVAATTPADGPPLTAYPNFNNRRALDS